MSSLHRGEGLERRRVEVVPRLVVVRLEEEVRKGQVLQGHLILDADGQRVDRLGEVLLRPDLRAQDAHSLDRKSVV